VRACACVHVNVCALLCVQHVTNLLQPLDRPRPGQQEQDVEDGEPYQSVCKLVVLTQLSVPLALARLRAGVSHAGQLDVSWTVDAELQPAQGKIRVARGRRGLDFKSRKVWFGLVYCVLAPLAHTSLFGNLWLPVEHVARANQPTKQN